MSFWSAAAQRWQRCKVTRTVPIVFVSVSDPVGAGYVASLARPGANTTGFTLFEYGTSGKWLELLKHIMPAMTQAAVIRDPSITSGTAQFAAIQAVAPSLGVELTPVDARDASGIEHTIAEFTRESRCGLIVTASPSAFRRRELIIALAAKHQLAAVYPVRLYVANGGLISYGPDEIDQYRRAAGYVDRILKGERSPPIFRSSSRPSSSSSSTRRPRVHSALPCRQCFSPAPTR
jgi:putative ABC transport system substrate-binding protein